MNLKPYPKYKDSGIEWLGEIPEGWEVKRLKYLLESLESGSRESQEQEFNGVDKIPSIGGEHISWEGNIEFTNNKFISRKYFLRLKKGKIKRGDVLLVKDGATIGKTAIAHNQMDAAINEHVFILRANNNFKNSLLYYNVVSDITQDLISLFSRGSAQAGLPSDFVSNISISVPSELEQIQIAAFLDHKTAKIDDLIKKKSKLIELLKEKRQAVISHAVTKGIPPRPPLEKGKDNPLTPFGKGESWDLKMKDSGIEWLGKMPEGWEVKKIKHTSYVKGRIGWHGLQSDEFIDEGPYLVTGTDFINGAVNWYTCYHISEERYNQDPYIHLKEKDLLITKDGTIGKVALVENLQDKASLNSGIMLIRPLKNYYLTDFMFWVLNSKVFSEYIEYTKTGSTVQHLYQETFDNFIFPLPSTNEQENICGYLTEKTSQIDNLIQKIHSQIAALKEYRQALISNVATGKVRVDEI